MILRLFDTEPRGVCTMILPYSLLLLLHLSFLSSFPIDNDSSSCSSYQLKSGLVYSCQIQKLLSVPSHIPLETQALLLPFNRISSVSQDSFPELPLLQFLSLGAQAPSGVFSVGPSAFKHLPNLTTLDLGGSWKIQLDPRAFDGLTRLEVLLLDGNGLTESVLESDLFKGLTSLRKLDLSYNKIRRLRLDPTFLQLKSLSSIILKLNSINILCGDDLQYMRGRRLELLDLSSNLLRYSPMTSCTNPFENITLGTLDISSGSWNIENAKNFFKIISGSQVEHIKMAHAAALGSGFGFNNLRDPDEHTFSGLNSSGIQVFNLSNGFVSKLVPRVFSMFPQLLTLDLSSNKIIDIQPGAFSGLNELVSLNLSGNLIGELFSTTFKGLETTSLKALDLSSNNIGAIQYRGLDGLVSLESLILRDNALTQIPQVTLPRVTVVLLGQNRISNTYGLSSFAPNAIYLDLSDNRLTDLRSLWNILELQSLKHLFLGRNHLSSCTTGKMTTKSGLIQLDLSDNSLGGIWNSGQCGDIFKNMEQLESLNLTRNQLTSLPEELFQSLSSLHTLDLSQNNLRHLPSVMSLSLTSLKSLHLGSNSLVTISSFLKPLSALEKIDLTDVTFICDCRLKEFWTLLVAKNINIQVGSRDLLCIQPTPPFSEIQQNSYLRNCV
ncbi:toll-like receptor 5 [Discoglossus pictus]